MKTQDNSPSIHTAHHHAHDDKNHFLAPFILILVFAVIETIGGFWTHSLALLGDAGHMFSDVAALGLAWFAASHAKKSSAKRHASGMSHSEIIASIINSVIMLIVVIAIIYEAVQRFRSPHDVAGVEVMVIAFLGLVVNIIVAKKMHHDAHEHGKNNLNHRAAFIHVLGDLLGSVAALVAGAVIYFTGYMQIDPILSIFISVLILLGTLNLIKDIWQTLHNVHAHSKQVQDSHRHDGHEH
jgi:cobalt-zinc-cadmium efflux system protein